MADHRSRALIFDMDGTLIDSEPLHLVAYQQLLRQFGHHYTEDDNREFLGRTDMIVATTLVPRFQLTLSPEQFIQRKDDILSQLLRDSGAARPGVMKLLEEGKRAGIPMAVASSATMKAIDVTLDILKIRHYFSALASGEEVPHGKPAPDVFLLAAQRLGVSPANCLVIEDTIAGIKAAKAAGMECLAVPCDATRHQDHSQADVRLTSLEEFALSSWLEKGVL